MDLAELRYSGHIKKFAAADDDEWHLTKVVSRLCCDLTKCTTLQIIFPSDIFYILTITNEANHFQNCGNLWFMLLSVAVVWLLNVFLWFIFWTAKWTEMKLTVTLVWRNENLLVPNFILVFPGKHLLPKCFSSFLFAFVMHWLCILIITDL